jgi:peptidoglycan/xylan/chitin deacetylase (PgdA/CDA1 family)
MTAVVFEPPIEFAMSGAHMFRSSNALRRAARVGLAALLCLWIGVAVARPAVIVTVDVESTESLPLPLQRDAVCATGVHCGLFEIARMLEQHRLAGTFFLNVYEYKAWGEPTLRDIARRLHAEGHEVGLHTHPHWAYDPTRVNMYDYSLGEQTRIVADGARLLQQWTGLAVVSHRSGAYTANRDTLEALVRSGIRVDSSFFPGHPRSRLNGLGLSVNRPSVFGGVLEIPVTIYRREDHPSLLGNIAPPLAAIRKIDVDWFVDDNETEARSAIDAAADAGVPYIVVFLHSFSLMAGPGDGATPVANVRRQKLFGALLDHVVALGLPVVRMGDIDTPDAMAAAAAVAKDPLPAISITVPLYKYLAHGSRLYVIQNRVPLADGILVLLVSVTWIVVARRRSHDRTRETNHSSPASGDG